MKNENITVNDGKGLFDSIGMIDSLMVDCNALPKTLFEGNYVMFCARVVQMVQKLDQLKNGVKNDIASLENSVSDLTEQIKEYQRLLYGGNHETA